MPNSSGEDYVNWEVPEDQFNTLKEASLKGKGPLEDHTLTVYVLGVSKSPLPPPDNDLDVDIVAEVEGSRLDVKIRYLKSEWKEPSMVRRKNIRKR